MNPTISASAEDNKRHLLEIANHLATGNTVFAANAAVELGQLAVKEGGMEIILHQPAADVAARHLARRLKMAALPGALRDEVQAAAAAAGAINLIARDSRGTEWLLDPYRELARDGGPTAALAGGGERPTNTLQPPSDMSRKETAIRGIFEGLAGLLQYDPVAVAESVCALSSLMRDKRATEELNTLDDPTFRRVISGMLNALYTQPGRVAEQAVEGLLLLVDCEFLRRRLFRLPGWDRLLVGELADLTRTTSRHYAMALLCTFFGYEDFRHQLLQRVETLQPLVAELTVMLQTSEDALGMACAALGALGTDDVSRRQLLHMPHSVPLLTVLINALTPTPTSPSLPATTTAPVLSVLRTFSQDLFSQVRLLSLHLDPAALPRAVVAALMPPPWWWAPMWVDHPEVKEAAKADAARVLVNLLGNENNCRVLRQRHSQVTVLPEWYVSLTSDVRSLLSSPCSEVVMSAAQALCALMAAGGVAWVAQDRVVVEPLIEEVVKMMAGTDQNDKFGLAGMAADTMFMLVGGKEVRRDQESVLHTLMPMLSDANLNGLIRALSNMLQLSKAADQARVSAIRTLRVILGGGKGVGESLLSRVMGAPAPGHSAWTSWLADLTWAAGGTRNPPVLDDLLCGLACALGSGLTEQQGPAAGVLRSFLGVEAAWNRVMNQNRHVSRQLVGGLISVLCAKDCPSDRAHAAALVHALSATSAGQNMLDDQEGREIYFMLEALLQMLRSGDPLAAQLASGTLDNLKFRAAPAWARRMDSLQFPAQSSMNKNVLIAEMDAAKFEER